jgi:hypothetical protein
MGWMKAFAAFFTDIIATLLLFPHTVFAMDGRWFFLAKTTQKLTTMIVTSFRMVLHITILAESLGLTVKTDCDCRLPK